MDVQTIALVTQSSPRRDGWTAERRAAFLECLREKPDVARACARAGLSRQAAYKLRRRDPAFALAWKVAIEVAHQAKVDRMVAALPQRTLRTLSNMSESSTSAH
jgi:hypothetical protein